MSRGENLEEEKQRRRKPSPKVTEIRQWTQRSGSRAKEKERERERERDEEAGRRWSRLWKLTIGHQRGYALIGILRLGSQSRGQLVRVRTHTRDSLRNPRECESACNLSGRAREGET